MSELTGRVILASASPRRRELLDAMSVRHEVIPSDVDESAIPADHPRTFAIRAAYAKALDVAARADEGDLVIAADTVVTRNMMIFGKPRNAHDTRRILRQLSGASHQVITGVAVAVAGSPQVHLDSATTEVIFRPLTDEFITRYINTGRPLDKAGAYGIQDPEGPEMIERINGGYFNVMGLPCPLLAQLLEAAGWPFKITQPVAPPEWDQRSS